MKELMMRVFVAGATGAIGKQLVPRLVVAGHEVHGMTRSGSKQAMLYELGAVPVVADALDPDQVAEAVARAKPDVIVHQLTAIGAVDMRHFDRAAQRPRGTTRDARAGFVSGSKVAGRAASFLDLAMTTYSGYSMRSRQATADVHGQGDDRAPVASAGCSSSMVHRSQSRMWIARVL
jgi:uncharacterized protein YbjT (DUF2867 family)